MKLRLTSLVLVVALVGAFVFMPRSTGTVLARDNELLKGMKVTGTTQDGGKFSGSLTINELKLNKAGTGLLASGVLTGKVTGNGRSQDVTHAFKNLALELSSRSAAHAHGVGTMSHEDDGECEIVVITISEPVVINLLGLVIRIDAILLEIVAVPGPGQLLGNLLCLIVHLLDATEP